MSFGKVFTLPPNLNLYHYAGNNPVRYTDPDGREIFNFDTIKYVKQRLYAESCAIGAGVRDFFGKIGNSVVNIFTGNASYQVYATATLNILGFDCSIIDLKIGSEGQDLSFTIEREYADKFLESFEELVNAPITLTSSKLSVDIGPSTFTLEQDGNDLKLNIEVGKSKSVNLGDLGEGKFNVCAGINISTNMNSGPFGTIVNGQSAAIERNKSDYIYYSSSSRLFELME